MNELADELRKEIKRVEEKLVSLKQMEAIMQDIDITKEPTAINFRSESKVRRVLKNALFSDIEVKQIINMYNSMKNLPNITQATIVAKIANTIKHPKKRVYKKLYYLGKKGIISFNLAISAYHAPKQIIRRKKLHRWTPVEEHQIINYKAMGKRTSEIASLMNLSNKAVSNKVAILRMKGLIPKVYA